MINYLEDSGDEVREAHATKLRDISHLELHKIVVRMRLMSYNNMIGWALENVDIKLRAFKTLKR
jgi:hypothetical protein